MGDKTSGGVAWKNWGAYILINDVWDAEAYAYKMKSYLLAIQDIVNQQANGKSFTQTYTKGDYEATRKKLKNKTLYIIKEEIPEIKKKSIDWASELQSAYGYKLIIAPRDEVAKMIKDEDNGAVFHWVQTEWHKIFTLTLQIFKTGSVLYATLEKGYLANRLKYTQKVLADISK